MDCFVAAMNSVARMGDGVMQDNQNRSPLCFDDAEFIILMKFMPILEGEGWGWRCHLNASSCTELAARAVI